MTQNAALQEEILPAGGIADFIMDDAEIEALEKQETIEAFGDQGIANFNNIARRMASYGRYGDDTVAHVETGELVIPKALIQGNDKLKESIFDHLRELGVEDPERYIVGSGENSINPETGLPEFFFKKIFRAAKKAVSSVARAVKKTVKKIGKVIKKAAPVLLTIGLTPFVGPVYAGAISGGIGSLLNGGNLKDALRTAALGGVVGGIGAGISGSLSGGVSGAISNVKSALNPNLLSSGFSRLGGVLTGQEAFSAREFLPKFLRDQKAVTVTDPVQAQAPAQAQALLKAQAPIAVGPQPGDINLSAGALDANQPFNQFTDQLLQAPPPPDPTVPFRNVPLTQSIKDLDFGQVFFPDQPTAAQVAVAQGDAARKAVEAFKIANPNASQSILDKIAEKAAAGVTKSSLGPGLIRTFGPAAAAATGAAAAGGFFDTPDPPSPEQTAAEYKRYLIAAGYPEDYSTYFYNPDGTRTEEGKKYLVAGLGAMAPVRTFEDGGDVFPRRTGGIGPNEGTPNEDSVRAMLMPGEFVMTTDAVRGADPTGQGNLNNGISTMYDMMSNLEMRGRAAA